MCVYMPRARDFNDEETCSHIYTVVCKCVNRASSAEECRSAVEPHVRNCSSFMIFTLRMYRTSDDLWQLYAVIRLIEWLPLEMGLRTLIFHAFLLIYCSLKYWHAERKKSFLDILIYNKIDVLFLSFFFTPFVEVASIKFEFSHLRLNFSSKPVFLERRLTLPTHYFRDPIRAAQRFSFLEKWKRRKKKEEDAKDVISLRSNTSIKFYDRECGVSTFRRHVVKGNTNEFCARARCIVNRRLYAKQAICIRSLCYNVQADHDRVRTYGGYRVTRACWWRRWRYLEEIKKKMSLINLCSGLQSHLQNLPLSFRDSRVYVYSIVQRACDVHLYSIELSL